MLNRIKAILRAGLLFALIGIGLLPGSAQDLTPETFLLTFIPNIQFAPMYVAIAEGHLAEAGYEVTLEYLNEPDVLDLVAAGQNRFGVVSGEQVILAAQQGRAVSYVYTWFQQYPIGIVVSASSDITSLADLAGRKVGIPGRFGASYSGLTAMLAAAGLDETAIQLEEIGFNAPEVFCLGAVEAAVVYSNNEPLQIRNRAAAGECGTTTDVRVFQAADAGQLVSNGLITSQAYAEAEPERVTAFVAAFDAGLRSVIQNPARAYLTSQLFIETLPLSDALAERLTTLAAEQDEFLATEPDRAAIAASRAELLATLQAEFAPDELTQLEVLLATIALWDAEQLGAAQPEAWMNMVATLQAMRMIRGEVDPTTLYTNAFLPATNE